MRILIVEEALRAGNGHWPRYVSDLAAGFREAGDEVDILGHREANEKVTSVVEGMVPWLERDCRSDARSQGFIGGIRHNLSHRRDVASWVKAHKPYDWLLSLSSRSKHLLAYALLARLGPWRGTRFLLLFVLGFGRLGAQRGFRRSPTNGFARFCFWLLSPAVRSGQVVIAAETKGMQAEIECFSGLPVVLFPHPVNLTADDVLKKADGGGRWTEEKAETWKSGKAESEDATVEAREEVALDTSTPAIATLPPPASAKQVVVVAPGLARYEKGSDIFQEAIKLVLKKEEIGRSIKFVMQWPEAFEMPDGSVCKPDLEFADNGCVEFREDLLTGAAYWNFLIRAQLIVLPYRRDSYHSRVSRVALEAAVLGKPMIYMAGTWTEEVALLVGTGVAIAEQNAEALAGAITFALDKLEKLTQDAQAGAVKAREFYTATKFRSLLVQANLYGRQRTE